MYTWCTRSDIGCERLETDELRLNSVVSGPAPSFIVVADTRGDAQRRALLRLLLLLFPSSVVIGSRVVVVRRSGRDVDASISEPHPALLRPDTRRGK